MSGLIRAFISGIVLAFLFSLSFSWAGETFQVPAQGTVEIQPNQPVQYDQVDNTTSIASESGEATPNFPVAEAQQVFSEQPANSVSSYVQNALSNETNLYNISDSYFSYSMSNPMSVSHVSSPLVSPPAAIVSQVFSSAPAASVGKQFETFASVSSSVSPSTAAMAYNPSSSDTYSMGQVQSVSPLVLDLRGDGVLEASKGKWLPHAGFVDNEHLVLFDILATSFPRLMEWVSPKEGLLCVPKEDGSVDGLALFGDEGGIFASGYEKLALWDKNHDGKLTGDELQGLYVWQDFNGNGKVDPGELKSVINLGITEIGVHPDKRLISYFIMKGKKHLIWDWYPATAEVLKHKGS